MNLPSEHRVAAVSDLSDGSALEAVVNGRVVALFQVDGKIYALDGMCPHAGGPLGKGTVNGCIVTCPWHGWQFDVTTGQHCLTENLTHEQFVVRVDGDDIYVRMN